MFALTPGQPVEIGSGIWRLLALNPGMMSGPGTNTYLMADHDGLAVLDPGPADSRHVDNILRAAQSLNMPLTRLLVTHTHRDHSPAVALLRSHCRGPVIGPPILDDPLQDDSWAPDVVLADGEQIDLGKLRLRVIATPGHVSNHLCYLEENSGLLFSGDHLINGSTVVIAPPAGSMSDYLRSLRRLLDETISHIAPGHGDLILDPVLTIEATIGHRLAREEKVFQALNDQPDSLPADLVALVYNDVPTFLHGVAAFSLDAHLIRLAELQRAVRTEDGRYRPA
ncbi:MBL fold metallo-hydrolase [Alcanivorax sp. 1008]|uniref:MBL fold metallo-hydrolase n=1 Tax=Alcanivorax sp. 1008 TaxID=2816853 RepID=UPI001D684091|nr:MBL fold metallo-hydrolase [Alcanivorax sp. 1008]MCC1497747.1 MBL fold metallo-hydrolase [Alcanivorax sp. 1008]